MNFLQPEASRGLSPPYAVSPPWAGEHLSRPRSPPGTPERRLLKAIVVGRGWRQCPLRLLSQELGRGALPNSGAQLLSGYGRTLPQSPFPLILGFSSLLSFSFHDFLSHCQLQLLANPSLPHPASCPPCNASSPVIFG